MSPAEGPVTHPADLDIRYRIRGGATVVQVRDRRSGKVLVELWPGQAVTAGRSLTTAATQAVDLEVQVRAGQTRAGRPAMSHVVTLLPGPHQPLRPGWDCACCRLPYPCPRAQELLVQAYGQQTGVPMVQLMEMALGDGVPQPELFDRFIAWTQPALAGST